MIPSPLVLKTLRAITGDDAEAFKQLELPPKDQVAAGAAAITKGGAGVAPFSAHSE